ncbi:hypothetical protein B0T22DRAFT_6339 [Podospora appendiculata]|uniref:Uncharacterized protein n=1 Tax=Podospora appendiculata TaxID=314037 RepID=A0AAE1CF90_9PEZI|nr:hypothetical protein B0T22DRAFT_6339 [Podospora appendiculata]
MPAASQDSDFSRLESTASSRDVRPQLLFPISLATHSTSHVPRPPSSGPSQSYPSRFPAATWVCRYYINVSPSEPSRCSYLHTSLRPSLHALPQASSRISLGLVCRHHNRAASGLFYTLFAAISPLYLAPTPPPPHPAMIHPWCLMPCSPPLPNPLAGRAKGPQPPSSVLGALPGSVWARPSFMHLQSSYFHTSSSTCFTHSQDPLLSGSPSKPGFAQWLDSHAPIPSDYVTLRIPICQSLSV